MDLQEYQKEAEKQAQHWISNPIKEDYDINNRGVEVAKSWIRNTDLIIYGSTNNLSNVHRRSPYSKLARSDKQKKVISNLAKALEVIVYCESNRGFYLYTIEGLNYWYEADTFVLILSQLIVNNKIDSAT